MKKLTKLLIVLVLAAIVFVGVGCKKDSSSIRENPTLTDGDTVYFTTSEGSYTYNITKQAFVKLKLSKSSGFKYLMLLSVVDSLLTFVILMMSALL